MWSVSQDGVARKRDSWRPQTRVRSRRRTNERPDGVTWDLNPRVFEETPAQLRMDCGSPEKVILVLPGEIR